MEVLGIGYVTIIVILACFAIGSFFALPIIWYHIGYVSRKLSRIITLLESQIPLGEIREDTKLLERIRKNNPDLYEEIIKIKSK